MEEIIIMAVETASSIGTGILTTEAITKVTPKNLSKAGKVCVGVATATTTVAVDQIVCREVRGFCKEVKKGVKDLSRGFKKQKHNSHHNSNKKSSENKEEKK